MELRLIVADFVEWLGNGRPQWNAYQAMMSGWLIALDNQPGFRPVGETWGRMVANCLLPVRGQDSKAA